MAADGLMLRFRLVRIYWSRGIEPYWRRFWVSQTFYAALFKLLFFFSSRRRHTRLQGDWSSDVCSSDLFIVSPEDGAELDDLRTYTRHLMNRMEADLGTRLDWVAVDHWNTDNPRTHLIEIGRASCRERV